MFILESTVSGKQCVSILKGEGSTDQAVISTWHLQESGYPEQNVLQH